MAQSAPASSDVELSEEARRIPIADLWLDADNPRIRHRAELTEQDEILNILWREFSVDEIALSISANGFFEYEPLFAAHEGGHLVVVEGNRRLAAVRLLLDRSARADVGATDLPRISKTQREELAELPVIVRPRADIWQYIGFKHVNGPQAWESYSKAQYIAWVHNDLGVRLEDIAHQIGDRHSTVRRLYRGLMVLEQVESDGQFQVDDRWKSHFSFSHLYTGLDYEGIQAFLSLPQDSFKPKPVPRRKAPQLGELMGWLYGSKSREQEPVVKSQNPDLRILDQILQSKNGTAALRDGLGLRTSLEISKGDERLLREALVAAKERLQSARGKVVTGYDGEADLLATAKDIDSLARRIHDEMADIASERDEERRRKRRSGRAKRT